MAKIISLSDSDVQVLLRVVRAVESGDLRLSNTRDERVSLGEDHQSPEVYIALVPEGGIPALTGSGAEGDTPGSVECDIYTIADGTLSVVDGLSKDVYNLSTTDVEAGWVLVARNKMGHWIAVSAASTSVKIGVCNDSAAQFTFGSVSIYDLSGTSFTDVSDLIDTGEDEDAFFLLGSALTGSWVIIIGWNGFWIALNIECGI